ncbi:MAG: HEAT repeat domain-containing protein [Armatimonadota bacterium]
MDGEVFQYYLYRVTEEHSFCALTGMGDVILPGLEAAYWKEPSSERREAIIHIIWDFRNPGSLAFLAQALNDPAESVW